VKTVLNRFKKKQMRMWKSLNKT